MKLLVPPALTFLLAPSSLLAPSRRHLPRGRSLSIAAWRSSINSSIRIAVVATCLATGLAGQGSEVAKVSPDNWDSLVPRGKEVDVIYGDYVLRNDKVIAVIGTPLPTRNANMTVRGVAGCLIDLTRRDHPNDQLSAYYPGGKPFTFTNPSLVTFEVDGRRAGQGPDFAAASGQEVAISFAAPGTGTQPQMQVTYRLAEGESFVTIDVTYTNTRDQALSFAVQDSIRADRTFQFDTHDQAQVYWAYDEWFGQAYGIWAEGRTIARTGRGGNTLRFSLNGTHEYTLDKQETLRVTKRIAPFPHTLALRAEANQWLDLDQQPTELHVTDPRGPVYWAKVEVKRGEQLYGAGRTDREGKLSFALPPGEYEATVKAIGRPSTQVKLLAVDGSGTQQVAVSLAACSYAVGQITDTNQRGVPCKIAFIGQAGTPDPDFGPESGSGAVKNLVYTADGAFRQEIAPGTYQVLISRGPEYDAISQQVTFKAGQEQVISGKLKRVVETKGWISADYHSHSSPSGDNTSSQLGRVLNLLAEHIEFAPCTEHNRVDTYVPHLQSLGASGWMATCTGMELTGSPLPVNHQNAFPLQHVPRTQDGGGPTTDTNPVVQIERLALWDQGSPKLVQGNHPDLVQVLGDRDTDGQYDGGFKEMFGFMDVMEVHPPIGIFQPVQANPAGNRERNPMFHWLQLLNLGYRIPGVVNTDAHYNYHGSGWLRNYIKSSTDDPAQVDTMEMVQASERGNVIMTNGPFLEVQAISGDRTADVGSEIVPSSQGLVLKIRVQCANWVDVNRVQVFVNGRPDPKLNWSRRTHSEAFSNEVLRFEKSIDVALDSDAHLIVAAVGEGLELGQVMGPQAGRSAPIAVSNPIFVDVDGNGFQANGDELDFPLPKPAPAGESKSNGP